VLGLLAAACSPAGDATTSTTAPRTSSVVGADAELAALGDARALWAAAAPADYTVTVSDRGAASRPNGELVAVHEGELVSLAAASEATVEEVFATIEDSIRGGADVEVEYDDEYGYPVRVLIDRDGDGEVDIELELADLEAMPIVQNLGELLAAKRRWEAQGIDDYRFVFRAECTCPDGGTFEVDVRNGRVADVRPLDEAAETSNMWPGTVDAAFDDLEEWFTDSSELVEAGLLDVDVRMDPALGYPRWFRVEGAALDSEDFAEPFTVIVTVDLVGSLDHEPVGPVFAEEDRTALERARARWSRTGLRDYRHVVTVHCECPPESAGPFLIIVRDGEAVSAELLTDPSVAAADLVSIDDTFDVIANAVAVGTDVDVQYDELTGHPSMVIIDPEAVAVDGGLAFSITDLEPLGDVGYIAGTVVADEPIGSVPVFVGPLLGDGLVPKGDAIDGTFFIAVVPGMYVVTAQRIDGVGQPTLVDVDVAAGEIVRVEIRYAPLDR
jgi:hypothetical protein